MKIQGKLADVMSRKLLITISLILQTVCPVGLSLTRKFELDLVYAFVYGTKIFDFVLKNQELDT